MLLPDMRTIYITSMLVNLILAALMLVYWRTQKTYEGFGYMTLANAMIAAAFLMFAFRGLMPELISVLFANLSAGLAAACRLEGIRRFIGMHERFKWHSRPILLQLLFAWYFTQIQNDELIRALGMTVMICYFLARILQVILGSGSRMEKTLLFAIGGFIGGYLVILGSRAVYWLCNPGVMTLYTSSLPNIAFFLYDLLSQIGLTVLYIMLNGQRMTAELTQMQNKLEVLATRDSLTGFYNNRTFREIGQKELLRSRRFNHPLGLLLIDVDNFKIINDTYGHAAGDRVLEILARRIESLCRSIDVPGRMGGDEFFLLLPETSVGQAEIVAERVRKNMVSEPVKWEEQMIPLTISIGTTELNPLEDDFDMMLKRADDALYEAKRTGRNRVVAR